MPADLTRIAQNEAEMEAFGQRLGGRIGPPLTVYFHGSLGAGKTTLIRGLLHGLGHEGAVTSPTYTLVEPYFLPQLTVYHLDLYRLESPDEIETIGLRDCLDDDSILLIEWPEKAKGELPPADLSLELDYIDEGRSIALTLNSSKMGLINLDSL